ncbi:hypothetical protein Hypma_012270 [Hypsizygus marmoreus]|uniref:Secreted protein n=1 Tax=Hypsizygus marmoreus TaxID=39966 RepID=A0A369JME5_HYPMA|nr:hypothetical protein Hypma_012270 [Hypsizygus marmoreus]
MQLIFFMLAATFGCAITFPVLDGAEISADTNARGLDLEMRAPQDRPSSTSDAPQHSHRNPMSWQDLLSSEDAVTAEMRCLSSAGASPSFVSSPSSASSAPTSSF